MNLINQLHDKRLTNSCKGFRLVIDYPRSKPVLMWAFICVMLINKTGSCSEDWIGLPAESAWAVGFRLYQDESDDSSQELFLFTTLTENTTMNVQLGRSILQGESSSFDSENISALIDWSTSSEVNLGIGYEFQGKSKELEIDQYVLQLGWTPYPFFYTFQYSNGDVYIFTQKTRNSNNPSIPIRLQSDVNSQALSIGYLMDSLTLTARFQHYEYELDLTVLKRRPLLSTLIKPAALTQSGLLISEQFSFSVDYPLEGRDLTWHLLSSRSALDNDETFALQFDWIEHLGKHSSLFVSLNRSDEEQANWSLGMGLEWSS
jgi:hypothetical protein